MNDAAEPPFGGLLSGQKALVSDIVTVLTRADELYCNRARPGAVRDSVRVLADTQGGGERYEVQWRIARSMFFLGQQSQSDESRRQLHASGIGAGETAARLSPGRVEGHFWLGVNLALFAEAARGIRGARALLRARTELRRAADVSEVYHAAGPLRALGRLEHKAPRLLGGSRGRARAYFDRALSVAPSSSVTLIYAAELAVESAEPRRAVRLLEELAALPVDPDWEFENLRDRELGNRLRERLGRR